MTGPARLFLVFPLVFSVHHLGTSMFIGSGRAGPVIRLQIAAVALNLALSIILVGPMGISGVILGTVITNAVTWPFYLRLSCSPMDSPSARGSEQSFCRTSQALPCNLP